MSRIRDITKFLGLTAAANPTNLPLASTGDALDSAEALALITGGDAITITSGVVNHDDTSSQASVNNSGSNFIQDITLDTYGHVTAITSAEAGGGGGLGNYGIVNSTGTGAAATGSSAIAIGENATATGQRSVTIGNLAGQSTSGSWRGVNIGYYAGRHNRGNYNIAIGAEAMGNSINYSGISGADNIAIGQRAMTSNTGVSGYSNVAIGGGDATYGVLGRLTSGDLNVAVGALSGKLITTGGNNVCVGGYAGSSLSTGNYNVAIGYNAGGTGLGTGSNNLYIGPSALALSGSSNEIVIGNGTGKGNGSGFITSTNTYNGLNSSSWQTTSDSRIKTNITNYTTGLTILDQVDVKTYNYLSDSDIATAHPELADSDGLVHEGLDTTKTVVGIMAQDLETLLPNSVTTRDNGIKSVNKDELFWVMLNSIKELKARVEALENA